MRRSYSLALVVTVVVMYVFKAAQVSACPLQIALTLHLPHPRPHPIRLQPALLYLVPACLGAAVLTALYRQELDALLEYEDEPPSYHFGVLVGHVRTVFPV